MKQRIIIILFLLFFGCVASASAFNYNAGYIAKITSSDVTINYVYRLNSSGPLHPGSLALSGILPDGSVFFTGPGLDSYVHYEADVLTLNLSSMSGKSSKINIDRISILPIKEPAVPNLFADVAGKENIINTMMDNTGGTGQDTGIDEGETPTMEGSQQCEENRDEVPNVVPPSPVPEPATLFLLGVGLLGAGWYSRKKPAHG